MNALEAKKRALAAESEVYREMLKLELHNLRLYALRTKQRLTGLTRPNPLLLLVGPLLGTLFRRRRKRSVWRQAAMSLLSWQFTNRILPYLSGWLGSRVSPSQSEKETLRR
jgi:hypothetical protein